MRSRIRLTTTFLFALLVLGGVASVVVAAPASAQELTENSTAAGERIDNNTIITNKDYDSDLGRATISIYSESRQRVFLSDAGALFAGKEIDTASTLVHPDDHVNLSVRITEVDGVAAVGIQTDETHRGLLIEEDSFLLSGPWDATDAQVSGAAGLLAGLIVTTAFAWRRTSRKTEKTGAETMSLQLAALCLLCWLIGVLYGGYLMERRLQNRSVLQVLGVAVRGGDRHD